LNLSNTGENKRLIQIAAGIELVRCPNLATIKSHSTSCYSGREWHR
jgi:hypothetical protein